MYRLIKYTKLCIRLCLISITMVTALGCVPKNQMVRDQLVVEKLRLRITKVRNAIAETRNVIATSRGAKYLPELYMRLAELLSEEARYHYMVSYEREQRSTKALHVPQVRFLKEQSISIYKSILTRYPKSRLADRILFNISHEQRELGIFEDMKVTLERLVNDYPDSSYRTEALLVLGDYYFDKTEFVVARKYFDQIVDQKNSVLKGLALYKLGWVDVNQGNCPLALNHFEKAIRISKKESKPGELNKQEPEKIALKGDFAIPEEDVKQEFAGHNTVNVQREALVDLTYCYAQERKPRKAVEYLRHLASTREAYVAALEKMANRYALIEQPVGAADVARELLRLAPDDEERLDDARMLHTAVTRMKDYSLVGEDVFLVLRAMRRQVLDPDLDSAAKKLIEKEFELIARDFATKSHGILTSKEKVESKWTKEPANYEQTAKAYISYLDSFPQSLHKIEIVENLADVLMETGDYLEAGHRYREAARLLGEPALLDSSSENKGQIAKNKKSGKPAKMVDKATLEKKRKRDRIDALYNATVAYQKSLASEKVRDHFSRLSARAGLRVAGGLYLADAFVEPEKNRKIKFAIAQSYYDEGNYLSAIDLLTAIAYEFPQTEQGSAAVHMVLDSYKTINDISGLINAGQRFLAKDSPVSKELKDHIKPIVAAAEQNRLDELSLAASGEQVGGMDVLLAFADRYKNSSLGERALLSAFVAARAAGNTAQLYKLGEKIIEQFPSSEQAGGVVSTMGRAAATRFEFDKAIKYMERAAAISKDQKATLLIAAGELREQLADTSGAFKDYNAAQAASGEGQQDASKALVHITDLLEKTGFSSKVISKLSSLGDNLDAELASRLGMALLQAGRYDDSEEYFRIVVEGAGDASVSAQAKSYYGMAEVMLHMLEEYEPPQEIDAIEELIGVIDVTVQAYLAAARQSDPVYSQASLARLARTAEIGAKKLETIKLPDELSAEEKAMVQESLNNRAKQLKSDSKSIMEECSQRAQDLFLLDAAGIACIKGIPPVKNPVTFTGLNKRAKGSRPENVKDARERLSRNPDDLDALRAVGKAFMNAKDYHAARLVLARTIEAGGGSDDLNQLGVACYKAGDKPGAFDAFKRAKDAGSGAAVVNMIVISNDLGLKKLAKKLMDEKPENIKGTLLRGGGK